MSEANVRRGGINYSTTPHSSCFAVLGAPPILGGEYFTHMRRGGTPSNNIHLHLQLHIKLTLNRSLYSLC